MAKKNKRKRRKAKRGGGRDGLITAEAVAALLGATFAETVGEWIGKQLPDWSDNGKTPPPPPPPPDDTAGRILRRLAAEGPKSVPDLLDGSATDLRRLLQTLQLLRDFRLIEPVEDGRRLAITACGQRTDTLLRRDEIQTEGTRLLEGEPAATSEATL